jgi:(p)ppGpp synthase/HD superfamily hydrolase
MRKRRIRRMSVNLEIDISATMTLVNNAFAGKYDKGGMPYIFHLTHVASKFRELPEQTVALLHDIIEDTEYSLDDLQALGYPDEILRAVDCITKRKHEPYEVYLMRVKGNELARKVKIEDLKHNMDLSRLSKEGLEKGRERFQKYQNALKYLTEEETE